MLSQRAQEKTALKDAILSPIESPSDSWKHLFSSALKHPMKIYES